MNRAMSSLSPEKSRIHVLGLGSIGTFTAHSLREILHQPPVTLLLHRESLLDGYRQAGQQILLETREGTQIGHGGFDLEYLREGRWILTSYSVSSSTANDWKKVDDHTGDSIINNLVVSVKATQTVSALRPLRHRLSSDSTILFLQNGCGIIEDVNDSLFPDPRSRPIYVVGVVSHGVTSDKPSQVSHRGPAAMSLGPVPRQFETALSDQNLDSLSSPQPCNYLLHSLPQAPRLNATAYST